DAVEFGFAAHGGSDLLPLNKSASGGELSRVMLALEVVLAASTEGTTMVFDEVDAGVGGRAAVQIGRRLARLARTHQVIVVTHLPQVAAYAHAH
ncbi:DNA repair protein RecN, partial [Mycobacterium sp. ITM-2017-0098]